MMADPRHLLAGYATDSLTEAERQALLRAALDDQRLFEALLEEEGLRELLGDTAARQQVIEALEKRSHRPARLAWLWRPATVGDLLAVAAAALVIVVAPVVYRTSRPGLTAPAAARPTPLAQTSLDRLAALPPGAGKVPASLTFEGGRGGTTPQVRPGQVLTVRVSVKAPCLAVLLETRSDGRVVQLWPAPKMPPSFLTPTPDQGPVIRHLRLAAASTPGATRLRLVVAPPDVDLEDLPRATPQLTLVDLTYETEGP